jgi:manganese/iron transport system ATP-binding protein
MDDLSKRQISQLSGGQQQRMFIARAIAQEAELMLMDEPLTGLDTPSQESLLDLLDTLREQHVTVMVATHDLEQAARHFDRIMLLNHRLIAFGEPTAVMRTEILLQAYGTRLRPVDGQAGMVTLDDSCCDEGEHDHVH